METLDDIGLKDNDSDPDSDTVARERRFYRVKMVAAVGASYANDAIILSLFAFAGTIPFYVAIIYAGAGVGHVLIFSVLHWSGISDRFANPHLTTWQMLYAVAVQLLGMIIAPVITAFFLAIIFIIFAFGSLWLKLKNALFVWLITSLLVGVVLLLFTGGRLTLMQQSVFESIIVWVGFSSILLRTQLLGYYAMRLRMNLLSKNISLSKRVEVAHDLAAHDVLTGALNRRAILPMLDENIDLAKRKCIPCTVAMIDIDFFKTVNDEYGHLLGDDVLKELVATIKASIRPTDKLARYGGEEFLLLMPATDMQDAQQVAERMRADVAAKCWKFLGVTLSVTVSAGLASVEVSDDQNSLLSKADAALYQAKNEGRNRVKWAR